MQLAKTFIEEMVRKKEEGAIMKILLVDDDAMITELLSMKLQEKGFDVEKANSGWEALNRLSGKEFDLLITDLMMPDISGLTLLSLLKSYVFGKVPVIVISSLDQPASVVSEMGLMADDYFVKPVDVDKLVRRINRIDKALG